MAGDHDCSEKEQTQDFLYLFRGILGHFPAGRDDGLRQRAPQQRP